MKFHVTLVALATLATIALASAADAAIIYTYKGTIESGTDYAGALGGPVNQALGGKAFTLAFTLDPMAPGVEHYPFPSDQAVMHGGSTAMTGVMTIDGVAFDLGLLEDAYVAQYYSADPYVSEIIQEFFGHEPVADGSNDLYRHWAYIQVYSEAGNQIVPLPVSYASPFSYTVQAGDVTDGVFVRSRDNGGPFNPVIYANLSITSVSVVHTSAAPVPQPRTWALMIVGFGLAGGALRHRQRVAA